MGLALKEPSGDSGGPYTVTQVGADTVVDLGAGDQLILLGL